MKKNLSLLILVVLVIAAVFVWAVVLSDTQSDKLTVVFLNIGQGDAIFIEAPNGRQILIDGGPGRSVLRELGNVLPFWDRSIDVVIATHLDADHIGGLVDVLRRFSVANIIDSGVSNDTAVSRAFERAAEDEDAARYRARRGMTVDLGDGAILHVLFPDRDLSGVDSNTGSIVAQLVYGETEFLFTADSPRAIEKYLVSLDADGLESDVLKLGHHGSRTSTAPSFLGFVNPQYAVISAGENNRYGHPHKEVIDLLSQFKIPSLYTTDGTIIFVSDGVNVRLK